jgi:hypothetical protein
MYVGDVKKIHRILDPLTRIISKNGVRKSNAIHIVTMQMLDIQVGIDFELNVKFYITF